MNLKKVNKTELIKGMHELSLKQSEVYLLDTNIHQFKINYKSENSNENEIIVPAGRLSIPLSYAHITTAAPNPEVVIWSYFLDKFARGKKVPDEWDERRLSGFYTDWEAYVRKTGAPIGLDRILLRIPTNYGSSLTNCHHFYTESNGMSINKITSAVNDLLTSYFIIRHKFENNKVSQTYAGFNANDRFDINDLKKQQSVLDNLREFHDEVNRNVMSYFTVK